jgi:hypothetical protein
MIEKVRVTAMSMLLWTSFYVGIWAAPVDAALQNGKHCGTQPHIAPYRGGGACDRAVR